MTNGEKIKELFPNLKYKEGGNSITLNFDKHIGTVIPHDFWYAEYKEPTTKNNLGVDCISREQALKELKESAEHHANDSREEVLLRRDRDIIRAMPSVTPQKSEWEHDHEILKAYSDGVQDTLGKIRAEIEEIIQEETVIDSSGGEYERTISKLDPDDVFEIIDKYKAEIEPQESEEENGNN